MYVFINGKFLPKEEAKVSVFDHGFLYGDGVFEGIRSYKRLVFKLDEHIERLYNGAHILMLKIPYSKEEMKKFIIETLKKNQLEDAYIRVVVSRGEGDLGLDPRKCKNPQVVIITDKIVLYPEEIYKKGLSIITVPTRRNLTESLNPQIKSLNYLNNILAKIEAVNCGYEEAIMLNHDGFVSECTGDNIFIIRENTLITPPPYASVLRGITAHTVMRLASQVLGLSVQESFFTRYDVYTAEEVFLTGTAAEIVPVVKVDGRVIGEGKPGNNTLRLIEEFRILTTKEGVRY